MYFDWTAERVEQLSELWRAGDSAGICGVKLGCNRNAVLGKISRLRKEGMHFAERTPHSALVERPRNRKAFRAPPARPAPSARTDALSDVAGLPLHPPMMKRVPFEATQRHECRFPLWEPDQKTGDCCGNLVVPGLPYCPNHARQVYLPKPKRRRAA